MQLIALIIILISTVAAVAKSDSKLVLEQSKLITKAANDRIWPGFRAPDYSRFEESDRSLRFEAGKAFSWKIAEKYYREHSLAQNISITFHEAFHAFQRDIKRPGTKWGYENAMLLFRYQESSARNAALFAIEAELLREAIGARGDAEMRAKTAKFLAVRKLRQSELPDGFTRFETGAELNEGLAEYVGVNAVVFAIDNLPGMKFKYKNSKAYLSAKYERLSRINGIGKNVRLKFYYTGSAQGLLLDRLYPGWKKKVQYEGSTLQALLGEKVTAADSGKNLSNFLTEREYRKILENEEQRVSIRNSANRKLLKATLTAPGIQISIDHSTLTRPGGIKFFDPMNVTMVDPMTRVHTRSVTFSAPDAFEAAFTVPVVEDLKKRRYVSVLRTYPLVKLDGKTFALSDGDELVFTNGLSFQGSGIKFSGKSGIIQVSGKRILIKLSQTDSSN